MRIAFHLLTLCCFLTAQAQIIPTPTADFNIRVFFDSRSFNAKTQVSTDTWTYIRERKPSGVARRDIGDFNISKYAMPVQHFMDPADFANLTATFIEKDLDEQEDERNYAEGELYKQTRHARRRHCIWWKPPVVKPIPFEQYKLPEKLLVKVKVVYDIQVKLISQQLGYSDPKNMVKDIFTGVQKMFKLPSLEDNIGTTIEIRLEEDIIHEPTIFNATYNDYALQTFGRSIQKHMQRNPSCQRNGKVTIDHNVFLGGPFFSLNGIITGITSKLAFNACARKYPLNFHKLSLVEVFGSYQETVHTVAQNLGFALGMEYDFKVPSLEPAFDPKNNSCTALNGVMNWYRNYSEPLVWSGCSSHNFKFNMWLYQQLTRDGDCLKQSPSSCKDKGSHAYSYYKTYSCKLHDYLNRCSVNSTYFMKLQHDCRRTCALCDAKTHPVWNRWNRWGRDESNSS